MRIVCGCDTVIERINDGKDADYHALCDTCFAQKGDYTKSSSWKEPPRLELVFTAPTEQKRRKKR